MEEDEAKQRLMAIAESIDREIDSGRPMLNYDYDFYFKLWRMAWAPDDEPNPLGYQAPISMPRKQNLKHVIISCDASITENPGGKVAVGVVIQYKNEPPVEVFRKIRNAKTNNEGEYDAIYFGLTQLMGLKNNPGCEVEVRSDSLLVVNQLNGKWECKKEELKKRRDSILELIKTLPVPVSVQWRPRNSTPALEKANYLAQDALGVSRH